MNNELRGKTSQKGGGQEIGATDSPLHVICGINADPRRLFSKEVFVFLKELDRRERKDQGKIGVHQNLPTLCNNFDTIVN